MKQNFQTMRSDLKTNIKNYFLKQCNEKKIKDELQVFSVFFFLLSF